MRHNGQEMRAKFLAPEPERVIKESAKCVTENCTKATKYKKPWCTDHIHNSPLVQTILTDPFDVGMIEVREYLERNGPRTEGRIRRQMGLTGRSRDGLWVRIKKALRLKITGKVSYGNILDLPNKE